MRGSLYGSVFRVNRSPSGGGSRDFPSQVESFREFIALYVVVTLLNIVGPAQLAVVLFVVLKLRANYEVVGRVASPRVEEPLPNPVVFCNVA